MISLPIYDQLGAPTGRVYEIEVGSAFESINRDLLQQAVVMYRNNCRVGTFKTKSRAEVSGSSKKLFKQKGTGNARAGNKRTPVRRGGGHAFAKRPVAPRSRMPRGSLRLATAMAFAGKLRDGEVFVVSGFDFDRPSTKAISSLLGCLGVGASTSLVAVDGYQQSVYMSCRNIPSTAAVSVEELNALSLLSVKYLVATCSAMDRIAGRIKSLPSFQASN